MSVRALQWYGICALFSFLLHVDGTLGRSTGAPAEACETMKPGHGVEGEVSASPYSVTASAAIYTPGMPIKVTVTGTGDFKGILLQGRKTGSSTVPIGTFSDPPPKTKLSNCTSVSDALTHADATPKTTVVVTWMPPMKDEGDLNFVATIVQVKIKWWGNNKSGVLKFKAAGNTTPAPKSAGTQTVHLRILTAVTFVIAIYMYLLK